MKKLSSFAWDNGKLDYFDVQEDEFCSSKQDDLFHVGQSYDKEAAETVYCNRCGGNQFHVGNTPGSYQTVIKCVKCLWEEEIHSG